MQTLQIEFQAAKHGVPSSNPNGEPLPREVVQVKFIRSAEKTAAAALEPKLAALFDSDPHAKTLWDIVRRGATSESKPLFECMVGVSNLTGRLVNSGYSLPPGFGVHQLS